MREILMIAGIIILSVLDFIYIQKMNVNEKSDDTDSENNRKGKKVVCYIAILVSMLAVAMMMKIYYAKGIIFIVKRVVLVAVLWPIAISDYREFRIPNKMILIGVLLRVIILVPEVFLEQEILLATVISEGVAVLGAAVMCLLCIALTRGSLGMGDMKLMMLMGMMLGVEGICYAMFVSIFFSFIAAVILLVMKKKKKNDAIPFAPFILAGTIAAMILSGV